MSCIPNKAANNPWINESPKSLKRQILYGGDWRANIYADFIYVISVGLKWKQHNLGKESQDGQIIQLNPTNIIKI